MTTLPFSGAAAPAAQPKPGPVIVINVISFREAPSESRAQLLEYLHDAGQKGARLFFSVRSHDTAMDRMMEFSMPHMIPNAEDRSRFYHDGQLLFSQAELRQGYDGILQQDKSDIYLACAPYESDVPCRAFVNLKGENFLSDVREALARKAETTTAGNLAGLDYIPTGR